MGYLVVRIPKRELYYEYSSITPGEKCDNWESTLLKIQGHSIMMGYLEAAKTEMDSVRALLKKNGWEETGGID